MMIRNSFIIVLLLMLSIDLEVNFVFANKLKYRHSDQYNISLSREKRQVIFGESNRHDSFHPDNSFEFSGPGNDHPGSGNSFHDTEGAIIKSEEGNGFEFPSTSQKINLQEFLEENGETPTNRFIFGGNREGASCTTPTGRSGTCSFIQDEKCSDIRQQLSNIFRRQQVIQYILRAIQPPCGFSFFDFTLCCSNSFDPPNTSEPPTQKPSEKPTTERPTPSDQCGISERSRIVNGKECSINQWPWAVVLGRLRSGSSSIRVMCGGTLITKRHILSAAHCFTGRTKPAVVRLGEHDITTTSESRSFDRQIQTFKIHERYDSQALVNDIAIVTISGPQLEFSQTIRSACLPYDYTGVNYERFRNDPTIVGWGATRNNGASSTVCRQATVPIVPIPECNEDYRGVSRVNINNDMVCAGQGRRDSCAGDSGGPMLSDFYDGRWSVIGIVSFGVDCASERHPGVYTRVDRYLNWIERQIGDRSSQRNQDISFQSNGNRRRPQGNRRGQNDRRRNRNRNNQNRFPNDVNNRQNDDADEVVFG